MPTPAQLPTYSFQDSGQTLQLIGGFGDVPWVEHVQDEGTSAMQLSRLQNSQAVMTYMTSAAYLYRGGYNQQGQVTPGIREALMTTILGGYYQANGTLKHQPPIVHPYAPGMHAVEISDIKFKKYQAEVSTQENNLQGPFAAYDVAFISINFQTLPFSLHKPIVEVNSGKQFNPNWISIESHNSNTYTNAPIGLYKYTEGTYGAFGVPASRGVYVRKPESRMDVVIHNVFHDLIFKSSSNNPWTSLLIRSPAVITTGYGPTASPSGFINDDTFLECPKETLLLDAIELLPVGDVNGVGRYYNMRLRLLFNGWGWNRVLDPSGNPNRIVSYLSGVPPFTSASFPDLFNLFNPSTSFV